MPGTNPTPYQPMRAPRGAEISCRGWQQEAALRLLMNSLDPEVAERPEELVPCGAIGRVARDWEALRAIAASLRRLGDDETLLVQSGAAAEVRGTSGEAPRVLIEGPGWGYAGTRGALATAYEIFAGAARRHFGGTLAGRLVICSGMGGTGGALSPAATALGAAFLGIDADSEAVKRRVKAGYCDLLVNSLDEALRILKNAVRTRQASSVGLTGNCADVLPALAKRGVVPDLLTDQTPAGEHSGEYLPQGLSFEQAAELRLRDEVTYRRRIVHSIAAHVRAILDLQKLGALAFEFGNGIGHAARDAARERGGDAAEAITDGIAEFLGPRYRQGYVPTLWVALSGEAADIAHLDEIILPLVASDETAAAEIELARRLPRFHGLPARAVWLRAADRGAVASQCNQLVPAGLSGPVALMGGYHGAEASIPYPPTGTARGWPPSAVLQALSGACWAALENRTGKILHLIHWCVVLNGKAEVEGRI
jgi:urocanate hydratase